MRESVEQRHVETTAFGRRLDRRSMPKEM